MFTNCVLHLSAYLSLGDACYTIHISNDVIHSIQSLIQPVTVRTLCILLARTICFVSL